MKGIQCITCFRDRKGIEEYLATDTSSNELVTIRKMKGSWNEEQRESVSNRLKECESPFVMKCYDVIHKENELWVRIVEVSE